MAMHLLGQYSECNNKLGVYACRSTYFCVHLWTSCIFVQTCDSLLDLDMRERVTDYLLMIFVTLQCVSSSFLCRFSWLDGHMCVCLWKWWIGWGRVCEVRTVSQGQGQLDGHSRKRRWEVREANMIHAHQHIQYLQSYYVAHLPHAKS